MESLYTKYRPQTFADVVGQTHVVTTLEHAVLEGRTSHAYLFCGPRGTGKTTMARLLAKALMCERGAGHLPDGTCEQCRMIAAGEHPDVYELDAASRTGVDNVREEIISRVNFAPVRAPYKMYIIDEVHMLTVAAFNALLKTLEEPPAHVVFVLCTTDPQKIPETILSRVQRFDFHAIGNADIQARLAYICDREGFSYDPEALELVVRHARGGMRDAISELEQLSVSGGGSITVDVARDVLGEVSASTLQQMSLAMAQRDVPKLFAQVEALVEVGRDLLQFTRALAARLRDVYVVAAIGERSGTVMAPDDELPAIAREARAFGSVDRVSRAMQILSDASTEMRVAPNQRLVLEVALTKVARPQSELTLEALADRVASLERQLVALSTPAARRERTAATEDKQVTRAARPVEEAGNPVGEESAVAARVAPATTPASTPSRGPVPTQAPVPRQEAPAPSTMSQPAPASIPRQVGADSSRPSPAVVSAPAVEVPAVAQAPAQVPANAPAPTRAVSDQGELQRRWRQVVDGLRSSHPQHGSLLLNSTIVADDGHQLVVSFPKGSSFACRMLERKDVRANVDPMIASVFGPRKTFFAEDAAARAAAASMSGATMGGVATSAASEPPAAPARTVAPEPTQAPTRPAAPATVRQARQSQQMPSQQVTATQANFSQPAPQQPARPTATQPAPQQPVRPTATQPTPQSSVPSMSQQAERPASQQTVYVSPWEPAPAYADDVVPYDDFDAAPYEEDYLFGQPPMPMAHKAAQAASFQRQPAQAPVPVPIPVPANTIQRKDSPERFVTPTPAAAAPVVVPAATTASTLSPASVPASMPSAAPSPEPIAPPVTESVPAMSSTPVAPPVDEPVPASDSKPAATHVSTPEAHPAPTPAPNSELAATTSPDVEPAAIPAPARRSRRTGGIPADLIKMMTDLYGEGVTYSVESPDDEETTIEEDSGLQDGYDAESEFAQEPVDDADYDEED